MCLARALVQCVPLELHDSLTHASFTGADTSQGRRNQAINQHKGTTINPAYYEIFRAQMTNASAVANSCTQLHVLGT